MFLDPREFPLVAHLEAGWEAIRDESRALSATLFDPWMQREMYGGGWKVCVLYAQGDRVAAACDRCPQTTEVLARVPGVSTAVFSRLGPRAHIKAHTGWAKSVYRAHLGLDVPPGCRFRVGEETKPWEDGRCLIFDDTMEHEGWNDSDAHRTVLIVDFLRPGIEAGVRDHVPDEIRQYTEGLLAKA